MYSQLINAMAVSTFQAQSGSTAAVNAWWVVVIFLVLVVVVSLLMLGNRQAPSISPVVSHGHGHNHEAHAGDEPRVDTATVPLLDDLTIIEGIGPKIAKIFGQNGINTFSDLANSEVADLGRILDEARLSFADPSTWPEQARLASLQEWQALEQYQERLKGGRTEA